MRRNTPLSQYSRGWFFLDQRAWGGLSIKWKQAEQQARSWIQFDSVSFGPLMRMADDVYKETKLEDKLTGIMNRFENSNPLGRPRETGLGGVEIQESGLVPLA